ncbi:MAG: 2-dehydro-3-deoxygalactonokinase [Massilia sp.]|nr:2-dehydro-3-deoxygalactonokinase [Massilia sp.]
MHQHLLGIDWGTSNRRAYLIDAAGTCLATHEDEQGMLAARGRFAESLGQLLHTMQVPADVPVVMSGMVGSANGWREVPYLDTSVALSALPTKLVRVEGHDLGRDCLIVPGYCQRTGGIDVMRGEETQLLGALALGQRDGWVVLPGTHSKWVLLRDGVIARLSTFMTGELFAVLAAHGTLAPLMSEGDGNGNHAAFEAGTKEARLRAPLTNALFRARARVVAGAMPASAAREFVSGLLIGTEFVAALDAAGSECTESVSLIASAALHQRYARAAALFGVSAHQLDAQRVYCAALSQFFHKVSA